VWKWISRLRVAVPFMCVNVHSQTCSFSDVVEKRKAVPDIPRSRPPRLHLLHLFSALQPVFPFVSPPLIIPPPNGAYCALRFVGHGALTLIWTSLVNSRSGARTLRLRTRCARARTRRRARPGANALRTRARSTRPLWESSSLLYVEEVCLLLSLVGRVQLSLTSSTVLFELARLVFL
jgi:hypothetical protein